MARSRRHLLHAAIALFALAAPAGCDQIAHYSGSRQADAIPRAEDLTSDASPRDIDQGSDAERLDFASDVTLDGARDASVDTGSPADVSLDGPPSDSTLPDSTVDGATIDGTIDSATTDTTVDTTVDTTIDTAGTSPDSTVDSTTGFEAGTVQQKQFGAAADAHVSRAAPGQNYDLDYFAVANPVSAELRALLRFDLTSLPLGATVVKAALTICADSPPGTASARFNLYPLLGIWGETSVTWSTQPPAAANPVTLIGPSQDDECVSVDVTSHVAGWVANPVTNFGWRVAANDPNTNQVDFTSSENSSKSKRPSLAVDYY